MAARRAGACSTASSLASTRRLDVAGGGWLTRPGWRRYRMATVSSGVREGSVCVVMRIGKLKASRFRGLAGAALSVGMVVSLSLAPSSARGALAFVAPGRGGSYGYDPAELQKRLGVAKPGHAHRQVVMRLSAAEMPSLQAGDQLKVASELEVTTRCDIGQSGPGCYTRPTSIKDQAILTANPEDTRAAGPSLGLTGVARSHCTASRHHCKLAFVFPNTTIPSKASPDYPPCVSNHNCVINLVAWATNKQSHDADYDFLLLGENNGNFLACTANCIDQDKGRLMAVRERGLTTSDITVKTQRHLVCPASLPSPAYCTPDGNINYGPLPVGPQQDPTRTRLYSLQLAKRGALHGGEQFRVAAVINTNANGRARFSTQMFLTTRASANSPSGPLGWVDPGELTEHNGINCTDGISPCKSQKVGVFRVTGAVPEPSPPLYVNVFGAAARHAGDPPNSSIVVLDNGFVQATRYRAGLRG